MVRTDPGALKRRERDRHSRLAAVRGLPRGGGRTGWDIGGGLAGRRSWGFRGGLAGSGPASEQAQPARAAADRAGMGATAGGAVARRARRVRAGGVALGDQVVAILADRGRLLAGLPEPAAGGAAATRGTARAGQQQAQPDQGNRPDHDAIEEERASGAGHVVAEHREPVAERMPAPALPRTPATPMTTAASRMINPRITIMTHSKSRQLAGQPQERRHRAWCSFIFESTRPGPRGKQLIREGFITATDHPHRAGRRIRL